MISMVELGVKVSLFSSLAKVVSTVGNVGQFKSLGHAISAVDLFVRVCSFQKLK